MSFENPTAAEEREPQFPSLEEVKLKIEKLSGRENLRVLRTLEDEKGVYLHEAVGVDDKGDALLYGYKRSGNYPELKGTSTTIDVTYFVGALEDGMAVGGDTLADYDEMTGEWLPPKG